MARKSANKPKLTDPERYKRFVEIAMEFDTSPDAKDFERAFKKVLAAKAKLKPRRG